MTKQFQINDGGREASKFTGTTSDCGTRALAIATGRPYEEVYALIETHCKEEKITKRNPQRSSARTGIYRKTYHKILQALGFTWTATMRIGQGCTVHLKAEELPTGRLILNLSKHYAAFIDGVLQDTYDCSRGGTRCVYGYWTAPEPQEEKPERDQGRPSYEELLDGLDGAYDYLGAQTSLTDEELTLLEKIEWLLYRGSSAQSRE
jgi:hypothetical protein